MASRGVPDRGDYPFESRDISDEITALGPEGVDVVEAQQLVTLEWYPTPCEAHAHRLALEAAGLRAWVSDEVAGTMYVMGIGTRLQVRVEDEEAARAVLEDQSRPPAEGTPECNIRSCPRCGSTDVTETATGPLPLTQADRSRNGRHHMCRVCGHSWSD